MPEFHTFTLQEQLQTLFSASLYLYLADREFVSQSFQRVLMGSSRNWSRIKAIRATFLAAVNDMQKELGRPPEKKFAYFDANVFAAASLGQVHAAGNHGGTPLAVKIQYPGIAKSIDSDPGLLRQVLRPMIRSDQLLPILNEMAARLHEEVDYCKEAENQAYFGGGTSYLDSLTNNGSITVTGALYVNGSRYYY